VQDSPNKWRLDKWANDLSCAVFSLANVVTIMYYIVDTSTHVRAHACNLPALPRHALGICCVLVCAKRCSDLQNLCFWEVRF